MIVDKCRVPHPQTSGVILTHGAHNLFYTSITVEFIPLAMTHFAATIYIPNIQLYWRSAGAGGSFYIFVFSQSVCLSRTS